MPTTRGIALDRKQGFTVEGTFADWALRAGRLKDVLAMAGRL